MKNIILLTSIFIAANTLAECAEKEFIHAKKVYEVEACLISSEEADKTVITVSPQLDKPIKLELPFEGGDGRVMGIELLDQEKYQITDQYLVVVLAIKTEERGNAFREYSNYLSFLIFIDGKLREVFSTCISGSTSARQCLSDCVDSTEWQSDIVISPSLTAGFHDFSIQTKYETRSYEDDKLIETSSKSDAYIWNQESGSYEKPDL